MTAPRRPSTPFLDRLAELTPREPGESAESWCRRAFRGEEYTCRAAGCSNAISWPGLCDSCARAKLLDAAEVAASRRMARGSTPRRRRPDHD